MLIFKKEKAVRELVLHHLKATHDCLLESRASLDDYLSGQRADAEARLVQVKAYEQEADRIKREARKVMHEGAFLPQIRADLNRLVEMVDGIADAGDRAARFLVEQSPHVPEAFEADLMEIFGLSVTSFHEFRKAMKNYVKPDGTIDSLRDHAHKVGQLESEVDACQAQLTRKIFSSRMELSAKLHLQQLLELIASISDISEDVSDELESVVMGSVV